MNSDTLWPTSVLILGCGDIGLRLAKTLPAEHYKITGVRRTPPNAPPQVPGFSYRAGDITDAQTLAKILRDGADVIVVTMTPDERSEASYHRAYVHTAKQLVAALQQQAQTPRLILWISSTGVYSQADGSWVDEASPTEPQSFTGQRLLEAENVIRNSSFTHSIVRFSGIYGPDRTRLIDQVRQGRAVLSAAYTNRIHADDCAGVLAHLIEKDSRGDALEPIYLATDSRPAPMAEVVNWLAMQLKVNQAIFAPDQIDDERGNKRCSNKRILDSGYRLRYPDYQHGYSHLLGLPHTD